MYCVRGVFLTVMPEIKTLEVPCCAAAKVGVGGDVLCG